MWRLNKDGSLHKWRCDVVEQEPAHHTGVWFDSFASLLKHYLDGCDNGLYRTDVWDCKLPLG